MVVKVLNLTKCIEKLEKIKDLDVTEEIVEATNKVKRSAKDFAPVDTGTLKVSIHSKIHNRHKFDVFGVVGTPVEYSIYQEFGTVHQEGTPFMRPAININRLGITSSMKKFVKEKTIKISKG